MDGKERLELYFVLSYVLFFFSVFFFLVCVFKKSVKVLRKTETKMFTFIDIGTVVWLLRAYGGEMGCLL